MPTYDYRCKNCGHEFEVFQRISEDPLSECPTCQGIINRVISGGTGLIFKGSGFYITDYKNGNKDKPVKNSSKTDNPGKKNKGKNESPNSTNDTKSTTDSKSSSSKK